jgi:hypothetical protein
MQIAPLDIALIAVLMSSAPTTSTSASTSTSTPPSAPNLCQHGEKLFFTCTLAKSKRVVSVCGSSDLDATKGSLVYRARRAAKGEFDLEFPKTPTPATKAFTYAYRPGSGFSGVSFKVEATTYVVFSKPSDETESSTVHGVQVLENDKATDLMCDEKTVNDHLSSLSDLLPPG